LVFALVIRISIIRFSFYPLKKSNKKDLPANIVVILADNIGFSDPWLFGGKTIRLI